MFVSLLPGRKLTGAELVAHCERRLPGLHGAALRRDHGRVAAHADGPDPEVRVAQPPARRRSPRRRRARRVGAPCATSARRGNSVSAARPTRDLAAFASSLDLADVPRHVVDHAKLSMLDTVGCGLQGATLEWSRIIQRLSAAEGASGGRPCGARRAGPPRPKQHG